jgi:hypothetical protein
MHYGCHTALGTKLQTSLGLLLVELGMSFKPLKLSHQFWRHGYHQLAEEGLGEAGQIQVCGDSTQLGLGFPLGKDNWLMARFIAIG